MKRASTAVPGGEGTATQAAASAVAEEAGDLMVTVQSTKSVKAPNNAVAEEVRDLTVTDLRQWGYCPRVVYFMAGLGARRPLTFKMEEGHRQHERTEDLEARRSLATYGVTQGERAFRVRLRSERLRLGGIVDMAIRTPDEVIPVDLKFTEGKVARNHLYQVTAYALLLEECWQVPVRRGYIYLVPQRAAHQIMITPGRRGALLSLLGEIRAALGQEGWPEPTKIVARHHDCEFLPRCGDVDVAAPPPFRD